MSFQNYPDDSLLTHIRSRGDGLSATHVAELFERLLLPEPQGGEYRITSDYGYLMFLNEQGCTLRLTSNERCPPLDHHRILKPILRFDMGTHRLDINPGLKLHNSIASAIRLHEVLINDNICFSDNMARNCGSIPAECTNSFFDYSVVCDDGAIERTTHSGTSRLFALLNTVITANDNDPLHQERAYQPLRKAFQEATKTQSPDQMKDAWVLCCQKKKQGHLRTDWMKNPKGHPNLSAIAEKYSSRLAHLTP